MPSIETASGRLTFGHNRVGHDADDIVIVLVHGAGGQRNDWPMGWRNPGGDFRRTAVYALTLPGHDAGDGAGFDNVVAYAGAVGDFIAALGLRRAIVVGHSMGAAIALQLAIERHEGVVGIVLIAGAASFNVADALLDGFRADFDATADAVVGYSWPKQARESYKRQQRFHMRVAGPDVVHDDFLACQRFNVADRLGEIVVPVLIVASAGDRMVRYKQCVATHDAIKNSRLETVRNAGHFPQIEHQAKCAALISGFCGEIDEMATAD